MWPKGERWFEIKWRLTKFPLWSWIFWKKEIIDPSHIQYTWRR